MNIGESARFGVKAVIQTVRHGDWSRLLFVAMSILLCYDFSLAQSLQKTVLYSLDSNSGARLHTHDTITGVITRSVFLTPSAATQTGLAWTGQGLLVRGQYGNGARL